MRHTHLSALGGQLGFDSNPEIEVGPQASSDKDFARLIVAANHWYETGRKLHLGSRGVIAALRGTNRKVETSSGRARYVRKAEVQESSQRGYPGGLGEHFSALREPENPSPEPVGLEEVQGEARRSDQGTRGVCSYERFPQIAGRPDPAVQRRSAYNGTS